jgi:hypothetical protein
MSMLQRKDSIAPFTVTHLMKSLRIYVNEEQEQS